MGEMLQMYATMLQCLYLSVGVTANKNRLVVIILLKKRVCDYVSSSLQLEGNNSQKGEA